MSALKEVTIRFVKINEECYNAVLRSTLGLQNAEGMVEFAAEDNLVNKLVLENDLYVFKGVFALIFREFDVMFYN